MCDSCLLHSCLFFLSRTYPTPNPNHSPSTNHCRIEDAGINIHRPTIASNLCKTFNCLTCSLWKNLAYSINTQSVNRSKMAQTPCRWGSFCQTLNCLYFHGTDSAACTIANGDMCNKTNGLRGGAQENQHQ